MTSGSLGAATRWLAAAVVLGAAGGTCPAGSRLAAWLPGVPCVPCVAGSYSSANDSARCTECGYGSISGDGATACASCAPGTFATVAGRPSNVSGVASGATRCRDCPAGYASQAGEALCEPCAAGTTSAAGAAACALCERGSFRRAPDAACERCADFAGFDAERCAAGTTLATVPLRRGYWRAAPDSDDAYECRARAACPGGASNATATACAPGYAGVACASCARGAYRSGATRTCEACGSAGGRRAALWAYGLLGVAAVTGLGFLSCSTRKQTAQSFFLAPGGQVDVFWGIRNTMGLAKHAVAPLASRFETDLLSNGVAHLAADLESLPDARFLLRWITKAKAVFTFYQILATLPVALEASAFPSVSSRFFVSANAFSLSLLDLIPAACYPAASPRAVYLRSFAQAIFLPLVLAGALYPCYRANGLIYSEDRRRVPGFYVTLFLLLVHFSLIYCSFQAFRPFACESFELGGGEARAYMRAEPTIACDGALYRTVLMPLACAALLLYPLGIPLLYGFLLVNAREILHPGDMEIHTRATFVVAEAVAEAAHHGAAETLHDHASTDHPVLPKLEDMRRLLHAASREALGELRADHKRVVMRSSLRSDIKSTEAYQAALARIRDDRSEHRVDQGATEDIRNYMFLWGCYQPRCWWWELVEASRKIVLTGVLAVVRPGSKYQLCFGYLVSLTYAVLYAKFRPFNGKDDELIAESCQWSLACVLFITLVWDGFLPPAVAAGLLAGFGLVPVVVTAVVMRREVQRDRARRKLLRDKSERRIKLMAAVRKTVEVNALARPHRRDSPAREGRRLRADDGDHTPVRAFDDGASAKYEEKRPPPEEELDVREL